MLFRGSRNIAVFVNIYCLIAAAVYPDTTGVEAVLVHHREHLFPVLRLIASAEIVPALPGCIHTVKPYFLTAQHKFVAVNIDIGVIGLNRRFGGIGNDLLCGCSILPHRGSKLFRRRNGLLLCFLFGGSTAAKEHNCRQKKSQSFLRFHNKHPFIRFTV